MRRALLYLGCLVFAAELCQSQEVATTSILTETSPTASELTPATTSVGSTNNETLADEYSVWQSPDLAIESAPNVDFPQAPITKNGYKPLAVHFIQKFSNFVRPVYEKLSRIKGFLADRYHPSYGGLSNHEQHWQKLHEKRHNYLTGINGAIYGLAPLENHGYPFAYRQLPSIGNTKKTRITPNSEN